MTFTDVEQQSLTRRVISFNIGPDRPGFAARETGPADSTEVD